MKEQKSLQKFTQNRKFEKLLSQKTVELEDIFSMDKKERDSFNNYINDKLDSINGVEKCNLYTKLEPIMLADTKNQLWEYNHNQITVAISTLIQEFGRMPTKREIAMKTDLSRQTIHKHLKEYSTHPQYSIHMEQFKFMTAKVLSSVYKFAVNGDVSACKLFLNVVGANSTLQPSNTIIQNQNNYIQINGTILSQETIKNLNPEQLKSIEETLKTIITK